MARKYYSVRKAIKPLSLEVLKDLFGAVFSQFKEKQFFDEAFGYTCVDAGPTKGTVGNDPNIYFLQRLRKRDLWPILEKLSAYSEDDIFDIIEILYDLVSEGTDGVYHSYGDCGMHYSKFNQPSGQAKFRAEINGILADYGEGYELAENGEIVEKADKGLETLLTAKLPNLLETDAIRNVEEAIALFRRRHATPIDRKNAVRMLADTFEVLRPKLKGVITTRDEGDLFNIANNFAIRHNNDKQKTRYDRSLWLSWMFYFYLATLHFAARRLEKPVSP